MQQDWYFHQSLQKGILDKEVVGKSLQKLASNAKTSGKKLRALWAAHVTGLLTESKKIQLLNHEDEYVRAWTIQLDQ